MIVLRRGRPTRSMGSTLEIDVMFDLGQPPVRQRHDCLAPWRPPTEVFEIDMKLVVRAEIGGLSTGDVQVLVAGDELVIRGERTIVRSPKHRLYHESRVRYGPFEAAIRLPFPVDVESATAEYVDGFLSVQLPRLAPTTLAMREENRASEAQRGEQ